MKGAPFVACLSVLYVINWFLMIDVVIHFYSRI